MKLSYSILGNGIDDSFYGVTTNTRNTIKENDVWTYFTDRKRLKVYPCKSSVEKKDNKILSGPLLCIKSDPLKFEQNFYSGAFISPFVASR
jgi:hypothetical protein